MKVGITGLGYIGSTLANRLLNDGHEVVGIDNRFKENLDHLVPFFANPSFEFVLGDITIPDDMKRFYDKGMDFVVHSAAIVGFPACDRFKELAFSTNVTGTANVVKYKPKKVGIVYTSTGSVYKPGQDVCTELSEVDPPSWYGRTKLIGEEIVRNCSEGIVHRYATAMGIGFSTLRVNLLVNDLVYKAIQDRSITIFEGNFKRTFIHVTDIVNAIYRTLYYFSELLEDANRIYNVGAENSTVTKIELARMIQELTGCIVVEASIGKDKDCRNYGYSCEKFMSKTRWKPVVGFDSTIKELIKIAPILTPWSRYN